MNEICRNLLMEYKMSEMILFIRFQFSEKLNLKQVIYLNAGWSRQVKGK